MHNTEATALRGYGSGAVDFLFKPVDPEILRSKVRVFLELYAGRRLLRAANLKLEARNSQLATLAEAQTLLAEDFRQANASLQQAYRDLQTAQSQLVQTAKMASLGNLVAGVAHEINNPLSFVTSHLGTVRRRLEQFREQVPPIPASAEDHWERAQIRLKEMGVGLERIADLVIKLRTFSRLDEGEWKCVRISECIDSLLTILSYRLEGRIEVVKQFSPPEAIECFPGLLNQALMNLVANSIDAIEGPGVVEITAGADGPDYVLRIADTGTGIDPAIQERVVEPFFTTKPVGKGTGLGLSITYSIIKKHEGTLELKPRAEGGTEAVIRMPLRLPSA
jgi:two-component system NtrC family sensor kinase